jgi:hypothetical protein
MKRPVPENDPLKISKSAARLSIIAAVAALVFLASLHIVSPEFDPARRVVSEYALGHYGWVLSLMFIAWAVSSWALVIAVRSQVMTTGGKIGLVLLVMAGLGEALAAVFDVRRPELHGLAGLLGIPTLPISAVLISFSLGRMQVWSSAKSVLLWTASLTWVSLALMAAAMLSLSGRIVGVKVPIGWPNRFLVAMYCLWVISVGWQAIRLRSAWRDSNSGEPDLHNGVNNQEMEMHR